MLNETEAERLVMEFRGAYGRLCVIAAKALHEGQIAPHFVMEAFRGKGGHIVNAPLRELRAQRKRVSEALADCEGSCVSRHEVLTAGREAKHAAQEEWAVRIPMVAQS